MIHLDAVAAARTDAAALQAALAAAGGSIEFARVALGVSRATVERRLARYGLWEWLRAVYPRSVVQTARRAREAAEREREAKKRSKKNRPRAGGKV